MTNLPILVPASRLTLSPANVRRSTSPQADEQLRADIAARGLLQSLVGLPVPRRRGHYTILAGGRRLRAIQANIAAGIFAPDYPTPVLPLGDPAAATESSLAENFQRLAMNPADECAAFAHVIETEGATVDDLAKRFGVTARFVEGRLRLAGLAAVVLEALRDGDITLDVAQAFAATADTARQARVFEAQKGASYDRFNPASVRRMVMADSARGTDPRALLIGCDAYREAGGRIEVDLFSDAGAETWLDVDLLERLARERIDAAAAAVAAEQGFGTVRAVLEPFVPWSELRDLEGLRGEVPPLDTDAAARVEAIETELASIEARAADEDDDAFTEDEATRCDRLQSELDALLDRPPAFSPEQRAAGTAFVVLGSDGVARLHNQVYVERRGADDRPDGPAGGSGDASDAAAAAAGTARQPGEPVLAQRLAEELAAQRTEILRVHVASQPHFALDLGTFLMADRAVNFAGAELASTLAAPTPPGRIAGGTSGEAATREWQAFDAALDRSWVDAGSTVERFDAFRTLPEHARAGWLGWAVARTLDAAVPGCAGSALIAHLGRLLEIDAAAWWRPTAANYFGRVPKAVVLRAFSDVGGAELGTRYAASRKLELASAAERLFAGDAIVEPDVRKAAVRWVPSAMRFGASSDTASDGTPEPAVASDGVPPDEDDDREACAAAA